MSCAARPVRWDSLAECVAPLLLQSAVAIHLTPTLARSGHVVLRTAGHSWDHFAFVVCEWPAIWPRAMCM
eukprot:1868025-Alexandrium_andersonii.AAC.1